MHRCSEKKCQLIHAHRAYLRDTRLRVSVDVSTRKDGDCTRIVRVACVHAAQGTNGSPYIIVAGGQRAEADGRRRRPRRPLGHNDPRGCGGRAHLTAGPFGCGPCSPSKLREPDQLCFCGLIHADSRPGDGRLRLGRRSEGLGG